jgi:hypothetical protein
MRQTTWAAVAIAIFGAGAGVLHALPSTSAASSAPSTAIASNDVVSRAGDSESEVSASLASAADGSLAVAWIADSGGRDGGGRYVGVRVSEPNAGKLGPLRKITTPGERVSDDSVVALSGGDFLVTWAAGKSVYSARVSRDGVSAPVLVASSASHPRAAVTPGGTVLVSFAFDEGAKKGLALAVSHDGKTFARRDVGPSPDEGELSAVCGDDQTALVVAAVEPRGVVVHRVALESDSPADTSTVSTIGEHVARQAPSCFVSPQEAFVVYGQTERPQDPGDSRIAETLVFVRSRDGARNFVTRAAHRTPSHLLLPTIVHREGAFTLLAVMGSGAGDAHASASVIVLGADGRSQTGLTRTVVAPMTMVAAPDAAGWLGDSLGLAIAGGVTWAAVPDNGGGEAHVALVRVL